MTRLQVAPKKSSLRINVLAEDPQGYLWLGTSEGLFRFNGKKSVQIQLPDSLENVPVTAVFVQDSLVLAGFRNGFGLIYNRALGKISGLFELCEEEILACVIDERGICWFGSNGGGLMLVSGQHIRYVSSEEGLSDNVIHALHSAGNTVLAGTDLGLTLCDWNGQDFVFHTLNIENGLTDNLVTVIGAHKGSNVLIGSHGGSVCNLNLDTRSIDPIVSINAINESEVIGLFHVDEEIWCVTADRGLYVINWPGAQHVQHIILTPDPDSKLPGSASDVIHNREGHLVLADRSSHLHIADNRFIHLTSHDGARMSGAHAIACDEAGNIWFSNQDGVYSHSYNFSEENLVQLRYPQSAATGADVISIAQAPDESMWFGTFGMGVVRYDPVSGASELYTEKNGLVNNNVLSICLHDGSLWLATLGGVSQVTFEGPEPGFISYGTDSNLGTGYVYTTHSGTDGNLWVGTDGNGPAYLEDGHFHFLNTQFPETGKSVVSITSDTQHNIWFYSTDHGLQIYDGQSVQTVDLRKFSDQIEVLGMQGDNHGSVMLFTSQGIISMHASDMEPVILNADENFSSNYLNVMARDPYGQIWIGSTEAMIRYRGVLANGITAPEVCIEQLLVNLEVTDTSNHVFAAGKNHLTFHIAGLWFQRPDEIRYQYKLEGYDLDWVNTLDDVLIFSRLAPGAYTLLVRAYAGNDLDAGPVASYSFTILAPLWQRPWFIISAISFILLMLWLLIRIRVKALKRKEAMSRELFQSQFETLRNQVNPHFLFNSFNTLISVISRSKEEGIDYVEKLSDYFRIILQQRDKELILLSEELDLVRHYFFLQKKRFGENLTFSVDIPQEMTDAYIPPLTLQILAENAIKHNIISSGKPLHVRLEGHDSELVFINNLQEKTHPEVSTGIGLNNLRNRYRMLGGREIRVVKGDTTFEVHIPLFHNA